MKKLFAALFVVLLCGCQHSGGQATPLNVLAHWEVEMTNPALENK